MDTKSSAVAGEQEQAPPPPYSLVPPTSPDSSTASSKAKPSTVTSHLQAHLSALPDRIRRNQQLHDMQQAESDLGLLDYLAPVVESFLADLGAQRNSPPAATLTIVPRGAVPADAVLSGMDSMRQRNEVGRVFRVDTRPRDEKGRRRPSDVDAGSGGSASALSTITKAEGGGGGGSREFTDWGRWEEEPGSASLLLSSSSSSSSAAGAGGALLWWRDEDLARRLAAYLQPTRDATPTDYRSGAPTTTTMTTPVQAAVERQLPAEKPRRGWGWGARRHSSKQPSTPSSSSSPSAPRQAEISLAPPGEPVRDGGRPGTVANGDVAGVPSAGHQPEGGRRAHMAVTAEEVAFRRENDFGIWESTSGWAVVVTVKIDP